MLIPPFSGGRSQGGKLYHDWNICFEIEENSKSFESIYHTHAFGSNHSFPKGGGEHYWPFCIISYTITDKYLGISYITVLNTFRQFSTISYIYGNIKQLKNSYCKAIRTANKSMGFVPIEISQVSLKSFFCCTQFNFDWIISFCTSAIYSSQT